VRNDDHSVLSAHQELQVALGEGLLMPFAKRLHHRPYREPRRL
jgi:hypothetical protein